MVDRGAHDKFKVKVDNAWVLLVASGLVTIPATEDDSIPDDEAIPKDDSIPDDEAIPEDEPATSTTASAAAGAKTLEEMHAMVFPDKDILAALTQEQRLQADDLVRRAWEATAHGTKRDLPPEMVDELLLLIS